MAGPKVMRHTVVAPLPMVEKTSQGVLEVPEMIQCWKGSVFSMFSRAVANWDGSGYGALLQTPSVSVAPYMHTQSCVKMWRTPGRTSISGMVRR